MEKECDFCVEIVAPNGLEKLAQDLIDSNLNVRVYLSHYKSPEGSGVLYDQPGGPVCISMDTSNSDILFGSGTIHLPFERAKDILHELGALLQKNHFPYRLSLDSDENEETYHQSFLWTKPLVVTKNSPD